MKIRYLVNTAQKCLFERAFFSFDVVVTGGWSMKSIRGGWRGVLKLRVNAMD